MNIRGIGVDTVRIDRVSKCVFDERHPGVFADRVFTEAERLAAARLKDPGPYYAARFAAKEAVFKAVAHLLPEKAFDFRIVETLNTGDGCPFVNTGGALAPILRSAGVTDLQISITTEDGCATAFAVACG